MFQEFIISKDLSIDKFLNDLKCDFYLTKPQLKNLQTILTGMITNGYNGKISQISESSFSHRTSIGRFLSNSSWDENLITTSMKRNVINTMIERSEKSKEPVYFIIDDTISKKTKPSSQAKNPIENCKYAYSHLEGKTVYGHQIIVSLLSCNGLTLPYSVDVYDKETMSKIKLAKSLINALSKKLNKLIVLADSWYSSKAIFDATISNERNNYVGAIKTNRVLYPKNHSKLGIKASMFAKTLPLDSFDLVTVRKKDYYVYKYVGNLRDRKNITIVLSYPVDSFYEKSTLKAFISLDPNLSISDILNHYNLRWDIEPFFRECNAKLGLNGYQVRKTKAIKRYLLIMLLNYTYCKLKSKFLNHFNVGFKKVKNELEKERVQTIFNATKNGVSLTEILKLLKIA
ncbi:transposase [uncultured Clostridium sp.]|uniref:IS701 family transposase n=1 Tax=uncultured Clostridium sp. TaxID=59620 RepID=UPI0026080381|nr:transposase [uncultured Clostridium sp.]